MNHIIDITGDQNVYKPGEKKRDIHVSDKHEIMYKKLCHIGDALNRQQTYCIYAYTFFTLI